jgi:phosphatidate cytidylyltransferase
MDANLVRRIGVAAVGIPAALGIVYLGGWPLVALVAIIGVLGVRELFAFAERQEILASRSLGYLTAAAFAPAAYLAASSADCRAWLGAWWPYLAALWLIVLLVWALAFRRPAARPLGAAAVTLLAVLYAAALPAFLVTIRHQGHGLASWPGTWLVFYPLVVTWVCDTFAMFGGRVFGGPKLSPLISPGKTRSGALAGVLGALLVAAVFALAVFPRVGIEADLGRVLVIAAGLSVAGQVGDLAESLFKREAGVKDSGTLIPGHGGVLDRFDSLYFVLPAAAVLYRALGLA